MSIIGRYTVQDLREMANTVHDAGLGARGQGIYALLLGLALEKESTTEYHAAFRRLTIERDGTTGDAA